MQIWIVLRQPFRWTLLKLRHSSTEIKAAATPLASIWKELFTSDTHVGKWRRNLSRHLFVAIVDTAKAYDRAVNFGRLTLHSNLSLSQSPLSRPNYFFALSNPAKVHAIFSKVPIAERGAASSQGELPLVISEYLP